MDFMRRHLAKVRIPASDTPDEVLVKLADQLQTRLRRTDNMGAGTVTFDGDDDHHPAIDLGNGSRSTARWQLADPEAAPRPTSSSP